MPKLNELEANLQSLVDLKAINLDTPFGAVLKGGALAGDDPWDVFCGPGWILRRRGPGPIRIDQLQSVRGIIREELEAVFKSGVR